MKNSWTLERKAKQAQLIQTWQPWKRSTGPQTDEGRARASLNAYKGNPRGKLREDIRRIKEFMRKQRKFLGNFLNKNVTMNSS